MRRPNIYAYKLASLGGTFSVLHDGHKQCIDTAFSLAEYVQIGIKDTAYAQTHREYRVPPVVERLKQMKDLLIKRGYLSRALLHVYRGEHDAMLNPDLACVVTGADCVDWANTVNAVRQEQHLKLLHIHVVPYVMMDAEKLSSTRLIQNC